MPNVKSLLRKLFTLFKIKNKRLRICFTLLAFFIASIVGLRIWVYSIDDPLPAVIMWPVSSVLLDKDGEIVHARLSADEEWCIPIPLEKMGEWLPKILVEVEDKRFYSHHGIDFIALARASGQNILKGRVVSGASTISSQLIRLSNPRPRNLSAKIMEFAGAWRIENTLSKDEILEIYLNRAPFGGNIRGVEAASRMYFGKKSQELSLGEASLLIGLLKGPTAYRPDRNPKAAMARRQKIIEQIAESSSFPKDLTVLAMDEPLPVVQPAMPAEAWHFADLAFAELNRWNGYNNGGVFWSTLDMPVQNQLENTLRNHLAEQVSEMTAAAIVVDNNTSSIIAYVGNARFDPINNKEWVDCARAFRSPGSALKPFVYLSAMESGYIIPASLLADTPLSLGGEAPRNFDQRYRGPVTVERSLVDSLNVPAVRVFRMLGLRFMQSRFKSIGFSVLDRIDIAHGDSLVLGAGEVTALELARSYCTLANLGLDQPLAISPWQLSKGRQATFLGQSSASLSMDFHDQRYQHVAAQGTITKPLTLMPKRIYTEAGCYLLADMLKDTSRLPLLTQILQLNEKVPMAFKTGTSYGLRDAWAATYSPYYTVIVWFGRSDGGTNPNLVGAKTAVPPALEILRTLTMRKHVAMPGNKAADLKEMWYRQPEDAAKRYVCALSGKEPSIYCPQKKLAWYIPKVWRTVPCDMHQLKNGEIITVWPPELEDFQMHRQTSEDLSRKLTIVSPLPGAKYLLIPGVPEPIIELKVEGSTYPVHWYANGLYLGEQPSPADPFYYTLSEGNVRIAAMDALSRTTERTVVVEHMKTKEMDIPLLGE